MDPERIEGLIRQLSEQSRNMQGASKEAFLYALEHQLDPMRRIVNTLSSGQPVLIASMTPVGMMMFALTPDDIENVGKKAKRSTDIIIKDDTSGTTIPVMRKDKSGLICKGTGRPSIILNILPHIDRKVLMTSKQIAKIANEVGVTKGIQIPSVERALNSKFGQKHFNKVGPGSYMRMK